MSLPTTPTLSDFLAFIRANMAISTTALPDASPWIEYAYDVALLTVNTQIACVSPALYVQAIYNLAGDIMINNAQDAVPPVVYANKQGFFAYMRSSMNLNGFVSGVISSASDNGTSESMVVPEALSGLTLADLQNLKTPWGRNYLAIAQQAGPGVWGIS